MKKPVTKKEQRERTRALIIHEAIRLFAKKGFQPTSTQDLAQAIGMTTGTLYWHFEDKEALLIAVIEELEQRLADNLMRGWDDRRGEGPIETMEALIARVAATIEQNQETLLLVGVVGAEATDTNPRVEKALRRAYGRFAELTQHFLDEAKKKKLVDAQLDTACAAQMFIGMYMGGIMHQRLYRETWPLKRALPTLQKMLLRSLVGRVPSLSQSPRR